MAAEGYLPVDQIDSPARSPAPWKRLAILSLVTALCSGLLPGASLYVELLSEAGVVASICKDGASSCLEQNVVLSTSFSVGQALMLCSFLPIGLLFDVHGSRPLAVWGAVLVFIGMLLLQVPLLGAKLGYDAITWYVFPLAVMITDVGSFANSQCLTGLIWHFPGKQLMVISLSVATYQISSLTPLLLQCIMKSFNVSLATVMIPVTAAVAFCGLACRAYAPTQAEFFKEAKCTLGVPLPTPPSHVELCKMVGRSNAVLKRDVKEHIIFVVCVGFAYSFCFMYQGLASDIGDQLGTGGGEALARLFVWLNGVVGGIIAPGFCMLMDHVKFEWIAILVIAAVGTCLGCSAIISWPAQAITSCSVVVIMATFQVFLTKYVAVYAPPNRFGTVNGVMWVYMMVIAIPVYSAWSALLESLASSANRYTIVFLGENTGGLLALSLYTLRLFFVGVPNTPVLLPEDEAEIAKNFGCKSLDDVLYVLHMEDQRKLLHLLSSSDPSTMVQLIREMDMNRLAEKLADLDTDELARFIEQDEESKNEEENGSKDPGSASGKEGFSEAPLVGLPAAKNIQSQSDVHLDTIGSSHSAYCGDDASLNCRDLRRARSTRRGSTLLHHLASTCALCFKPIFKILQGLLSYVFASAENQKLSREEGSSIDQICDTAEETHIRALSLKLVEAIRAKEKKTLIDYMMTLPVNDLWHAQLDMENLLSNDDFISVEADFDELIPGKEWARLLRNRPELKTLVTRAVRRHMAKKFRVNVK